MNTTETQRELNAGEAKRRVVDELADSIAVHAARIDAATHQLLTEIRQFDEMGGWAWQGAASCAYWLSWRLGHGMDAAMEKVRVARALGELPLIDAAFAAGQLSYSKVRAMTRVADASIEERLLEMARHASGAELERICRGFRRVQRLAARTDEQRRRAAEPDRWLQRRNLPDGMVRIEVRLLPDEAEVVWEALERMRRELRAEAGAATTEEGTLVEAVGTEDLSAENPQDESDNLSAESTRDPRDDLSGEGSQDPPDDLSAESTDGDLSGEAEESLDDFNFAPEPEYPKGIWFRDDESGELTYVGSDPPAEWPEDVVPTPKEQLERARALLPTRAQWSATRPSAALPDRVDALVALAERALDPTSTDDRPRRRPRPLLLIHLSEDRLAQALVPQHREGAAVPFVAQLHDGAELGGATLLRLACDAALSVVATDGRGQVLDVGRQTRTIAPAIVRALLVRDGHCQFPGCCSSVSVEAHHIEHWAHGGETRLDNLVLTCAFHHKALHEGGFSVERLTDGGLVFRGPGGQVLEPMPIAVLPSHDSALEIEAEQIGDGLVIDRRTSLSRWDGTTPDLCEAVNGLWRRHERHAHRSGATAG